MFERKECPECKSWDTDRVFVEFHSDCVEETRVCTKCPVQYTISYADPIKEIDEVAEL